MWNSSHTHTHHTINHIRASQVVRCRLWVANLESKSRRSRRVHGSVLGVSICRMWVGDGSSWGSDSQGMCNGYIRDILFYCRSHSAVESLAMPDNYSITTISAMPSLSHASRAVSTTGMLGLHTS